MKKLQLLLTLGVLLSLVACYTPEEITENNKTVGDRIKEVCDIPNIGKLKVVDVLTEIKGGVYKDRVYFIDKSQPITVIQKVGDKEQSVVIIEGIPYAAKTTDYKTGY